MATKRNVPDSFEQHMIISNITEILKFTKTKIAHGRRVFCLPDNEKKQITIEDLNRVLICF